MLTVHHRYRCCVCKCLSFSVFIFTCNAYFFPGCLVVRCMSCIRVVIHSHVQRHWSSMTDQRVSQVFVIFYPHCNYDRNASKLGTHTLLRLLACSLSELQKYSCSSVIMLSHRHMSLTFAFTVS